jgi:hypothetical protein
LATENGYSLKRDDRALAVATTHRADAQKGPEAKLIDMTGPGYEIDR